MVDDEGVLGVAVLQVAVLVPAVAAAEAVKKAAKAPTPSGADKKLIAAAKTSEQIGGRLEKPPPPNQKPPSPAHKPVGPNRKGT